MRCCGITQHGIQCRLEAKPGQPHCRFDSHAPKCRGTRRDGERCNSRATRELNWVYCRPDHDPSRIRSTDPREFRIDDLRDSKRDAVLEYRDGKDVYTGYNIDGMKNKELDHVVELHIVRDAIDAIPRQGTNFDGNKKLLIDFSLTTIDYNLNFTTAKINNLKFKAIDAFQKDYLQNVGMQVDQGLFPYLANEYYCREERKNHRFERSTSRRIQDQVKLSFYDVIDEFEEDQPLHDSLINKLQDELAAMRLM